MFSSAHSSKHHWWPSSEGPIRANTRIRVEERTIKSVEFRVERKFIGIALKENPRGRFLRITETTETKRNSIVLPAVGLSEFKQAIDEIAKTLEKKSNLAEGEEPGDDIGNR